MNCCNFKRGGGWIIIFLCLLSFNSLSWGQTVLFNNLINTDGTIQIHNEEQIVINPTNPNNVVAIWRDFREGYRQVGVGYSTDGGQNWTDALIGFGINPFDWESDPGLTVDRLGNFYAVTLCFNPVDDTSDICVYKSTNGGVTWEAPVVVKESVFFADKELMTCDQTGGTYDGNLYVSWTRYIVVGGQFVNLGIHLSRSTDGGVTWSSPLHLSDTVQYTQWSVPVVGADGEVYVGWQEWRTQSFIPYIVFSKSTDGGNNFTSSQIIFLLKKDVGVINGGIAVFNFPALATDISNSPYRGNLYVAFMDETPNGDQDIFFSRSTDQGGTWSTPLRINDDPLDNGADQFHPWVSVNQEGVISAIFYDRRNDTANLLYDVYLTQSYDGGLNFTANKRITTVSSYPTPVFSTSLAKFGYSPHLAGLPNKRMAASPLAGLLGEYIGISSYGSQNNLIWTDTRDGNQNIYTAKVITELLIPKLLSPLNLAYLTDNTPSFVWQDFSYYDTISYYKLQYSMDKNFVSGVQTFSGLTDTIWSDTLVFAETTYYWRVQCFNSSGDSSGYQDQPFSFTVDTGIPAVPFLVGPRDTTNDSTPLFFWTKVTTSIKTQNFKPQIASAPIRYTWQLANDSDFTSNLLEVSDLSTNRYQLPDNQALDHDSTYFWRVKAFDLAGNQSAFSSPLQFKYLAFIRGDVNNDKARNLIDIVYLVNYVFKGGPPPMISLLSGDVNCTGNVNLVDVVFLVNYVFKSGSPPCP